VLRKIATGFVLLLLFGGVLAAIVLAVTAPEEPAPGSDSAVRLEPGAFSVSEMAITFVDTSRPTAANGDVSSRPSRIFECLLWYPESDSSPHPLVVYSHGFMSMKEEGTYLAKQLASHGIVVVSTDYPLTNFGTEGGPNIADAVNQPADVSFLIDSVLALGADDKPFEGDIDAERIGAMGLSLGGLTTTLVTFHPRLRDDRIKAAISIAGPGSFFGTRFFESSNAPLLMIAGSEDAMIDYRTNALPLLDRARNFGLLTIDGGSHTGFASIADPLFRFVDHPDSIGCSALMDNIELRDGENPFKELGDERDGLLMDDSSTLPCQRELHKAVHPGRQHMITVLAATDFFRSHFDSDPDARAAAANHLAAGISRDFREATYAPSRL
jgi:predicted dienelactone hydrolase